MHVALTGISGFIGSVLAQRLVERGHTVAGLVRSTSRTDHIEDSVTKLVVGDQDDEAAWVDLLDGAEGVIHNSVDWSVFKKEPNIEKHWESNILGSLKFLHASAPRPFVFMSTIAVHHDMRPRWDGVIDEDHPLRPSSLYGAYKAALEAHLWADHFANGRHVAAIRPSAVYGMDPRMSRTIGHPIVRAIANGERFERKGGGKFVHVEDVADATIAALERPDASGRAFNMADCYARWSDWAQIIADELDVEGADIDDSSPAQAKNTFIKDAVQSIGVDMDRGLDGIRAHVRALIAAMEVTAR